MGNKGSLLPLVLISSKKMCFVITKNPSKIVDKHPNNGENSLRSELTNKKVQIDILDFWKGVPSKYQYAKGQAFREYNV
jgi:hypothetical protein